MISPIGEEGSPVREHADDVFDYIIKPAMDQCGIEPFRSDHLAEPGTISQQMFDEILNDDLCIAVITGQNPNVFYELAIAQAAARPVIILLEKGEPLPFDIKDLRCVYYDLKPRTLMNQVHVRDIVKQVESLEAIGWKAKAPFSDHFGQLGGEDPPMRFLAQTQEFGASRVWGQLLKEADQSIDLMGIGLFAWRRTPDFGQIVSKKASAGCEVRVLMIHDGNPALAQLINETAEEDPTFVGREIGPMFAFFSRLAEENENFEVRRILRGCPHWQLASTDQRAVCVPYLYSRPTSQSPLWECVAGHPLHSTLKHEFETLWQANASE